MNKLMEDEMIKWTNELYQKIINEKKAMIDKMVKEDDECILRWIDEKERKLKIKESLDRIESLLWKDVEDTPSDKIYCSLLRIRHLLEED